MKFIKIKGQPFEIMDAPVTESDYTLYKTQPTGNLYPKVNISFLEALNFCKTLNEMNDGYYYRLPTEEEWVSCLGKIPKKIENYAVCWENSNNKLNPIKTKKPNQFKLYDMIGNVWEWCDTGIWGSSCVLRGGSWSDDAEYLRSAECTYALPGGRGADVGFRLVRTKIIQGTLILNFSLSRELIIKSILSKLEDIKMEIEKLK